MVIKMINECWEDLVNAVVISAVDEWHKAKKIKKTHPENSESADKTIRSCETFFRSPWFYMLTETDGNGFIRTLKKGFATE